MNLVTLVGVLGVGCPGVGVKTWAEHMQLAKPFVCESPVKEGKQREQKNQNKEKWKQSFLAPGHLTRHTERSAVANGAFV